MATSLLAAYLSCIGLGVEDVTWDVGSEGSGDKSASLSAQTEQEKDSGEKCSCKEASKLFTATE